ncbi:hypothetical protein ACGYLO_11940 [Sulfitobacter sp. 1A13353]|uniref:hypothetical protein n=1 Tax=Sulfitobacter sp. 1A13353 TaxID=3368568 RepID=UPI00374642CB
MMTRDFKQKMKETAVRGETGALQLTHHATLASCDVSEIAPFTHFGTRTAARTRMSDKDARVISAYLDIKNPLRVLDVDDDHSPEHIADIIEQSHPGLIGDQMEEMRDLEPGTQEQYLIEILQEAGYDGLSYVNRHEDPGSISWMILSPDQICLHRDQQTMTVDPWDMDLDRYIGPAMVMEVFSIDGEDENYEHLVESLVEEGGDLPVVARDEEGWEARWLDDWEPPATVGLFDPSGAYKGFYMSGQLWVEPDARGAARSALMINAAADILGDCPTQNWEGMGFSEAGYAAHRKAYEISLTLKKGLKDKDPGCETAGMNP